jgi:hypothetical protein
LQISNHRFLAQALDVPAACWRIPFSLSSIYGEETPMTTVSEGDKITLTVSPLGGNEEGLRPSIL